VPEPSEPPDRPLVRPPREAVQRYRLILTRGPLEGGQRDQLVAWDAALVASGLPVVGLEATPPKPRFAPAAPLAAALRGEAELADLWLTERVPAWRVREALARTAPAGYRLLDAYDVWIGAPALPGLVVGSVFRATFAPGMVDAGSVRRATEGMLAARSIERERVKGEATVRYDLRPFLEHLEVAGEPAPDGGAALVVRMTLRHDPERGIGRPEEVLAELGDRLGAPPQPLSLVRERLVLAPPPSKRQGAGGGPRVPGPDHPGRGQTTASASRFRK